MAVAVAKNATTTASKKNGCGSCTTHVSADWLEYLAVASLGFRVEGLGFRKVQHDVFRQQNYCCYIINIVSNSFFWADSGPPHRSLTGVFLF